MEIVETKKGSAVIVGLKGRLDASQAPALEQKLLGLIDAGQPRLVIDFGALDYVSSAGLRVLLVALKRQRSKDGEIALSALKPQIKEVLDIAGFTSMFTIHSTVDEAVAALGA